MSVPATMRAMVLDSPGEPLHLREVPLPIPGPTQLLLQVHACGVCRTDLHIADGELSSPKLPLILGHEIVGTVSTVGNQVTRFQPGDLVGVPWLGHTCGRCHYCLKGRENLCDHPKFTGYTLDGGFAEFTVAHQNYCFPLPVSYGHINAAPLLCAGLIGYRSYRLTGADVEHLGITASAPQLTLPPRSPSITVKKSTPSLPRQTVLPNSSPFLWVPSGPATPRRGHRRPWMPP